MNTRLKDFRKSLGLSQKDFANKLKITQPHLSAMENGNKNITERFIKDLVNEFSLNSEWLKTGNGNMYLDLLEPLNITDPEIREFMEMYIDADDETRSLIKQFLKKAKKQ